MGGANPSHQLFEKIDNCSRSERLKSVFCLSSAEAKNTSIPASVRLGGNATKTCAQLGCSAEKSL